MIDRLGFQPAVAGIADVAIAAWRSAPQAGPVRAQSGNGSGTSTDLGRGGAGARAQAFAPQPLPDPDRPTGPPPSFEANVLDARAAERREGYARSSGATMPESSAMQATPDPEGAVFAEPAPDLAKAALTVQPRASFDASAPAPALSPAPAPALSPAPAPASASGSERTGEAAQAASQGGAGVVPHTRPAVDLTI